ncbi:hypothetical protein ACFOET_11310 [Parapedobacter deserti]|uniref:Uncharacterized protein n=1 Tax=Parapedobacter deserti TaxID=1912957 RepID=A0ABV7JJB5_9SPHI
MKNSYRHVLMKLRGEVDRQIQHYEKARLAPDEPRHDDGDKQSPIRN